MKTGVCFFSFPRERYEDAVIQGKSERARKNECDLSIGLAQKTKGDQFRLSG